MARRSDHTQDELKKMAIDAGYRIICTNGFRNFSARKVALEIGYTVGTIYHIFGSHDDFILNINALIIDRWYDSFIHMIKTSKKQLTVNDLGQFYINYSAKNYNAWSSLFEHSLPETVDLPEWYHLKMRRFFDLLEARLLDHTNGNKKKARRAARVLWSGIHGICILSHTKKLDLVQSESAHVLAKSFIENYLRGLKNE